MVYLLYSQKPIHFHHTHCFSLRSFCCSLSGSRHNQGSFSPFPTHVPTSNLYVIYSALDLMTFQQNSSFHASPVTKLLKLLIFHSSLSCSLYVAHAACPCAWIIPILASPVLSFTLQGTFSIHCKVSLVTFTITDSLFL